MFGTERREPILESPKIPRLLSPVPFNLSFDCVRCQLLRGMPTIGDFDTQTVSHVYLFPTRSGFPGEVFRLFFRDAWTTVEWTWPDLGIQIPSVRINFFNFKCFSISILTFCPWFLRVFFRCSSLELSRFRFSPVPILPGTPVNYLTIINSIDRVERDTRNDAESRRFQFLVEYVELVNRSLEERTGIGTALNTTTNNNNHNNVKEKLIEMCEHLAGTGSIEE